MTLVVVGGALSFVYMLRIYQRTFWAGHTSGSSKWSARGAIVLSLAVLLIGAGVWPEPLLAVSRSAAAALLQTAS